MLDACEKIARFTAATAPDDLASNEMLFDAVVRNIEILGEAAKQVPGAVRASAPSIPWRQIAGMRDQLAHGYFHVDAEIVRDVVFEHVPQLRHALAELLAGLPTDD